MKEFRTEDRRLEQFLYAHFLTFVRQEKGPNGRTVWVYRRGMRLCALVREYESLRSRYSIPQEV